MHTLLAYADSGAPCACTIAPGLPCLDLTPRAHTGRWARGPRPHPHPHPPTLPPAAATRIHVHLTCHALDLRPWHTGWPPPSVPLTLAPALASSWIVGRTPAMRVASATAPFSIGTFRSARSRTLFPRSRCSCSERSSWSLSRLLTTRCRDAEMPASSALGRAATATGAGAQLPDAQQRDILVCSVLAASPRVHLCMRATGCCSFRCDKTVCPPYKRNRPIRPEKIKPPSNRVVSHSTYLQLYSTLHDLPPDCFCFLATGQQQAAKLVSFACSCVAPTRVYGLLVPSCFCFYSPCPGSPRLPEVGPCTSERCEPFRRQVIGAPWCIHSMQTTHSHPWLASTHRRSHHAHARFD